VRPSNNINHHQSEANKFINLANFGQIRQFSYVVRPVTIAIFTAVIAVTTTKFVFADNLTSPAFNIKMGTINITGGSKSSASYKLNDTVGQTAQGEFNSAGYTIKAGFQYVISSIPFSFTISNIDLDYGSLVPGTPSILSNILTVTNGSAYGFTVKAIEDHPLKLVSGTDTIPDSACDLATPCSITDATPWTDNARFGFGYNVVGSDKDPEFVNSTYYRPFPIQGSDQPSTVMLRSSITPATGSATTVNYKINISGSQAAGTYQNGIQFIAIPAF
jgi:hypothetical protein